MQLNDRTAKKILFKKVRLAFSGSGESLFGEHASVLEQVFHCLGRVRQYDERLLKACERYFSRGGDLYDEDTFCAELRARGNELTIEQVFALPDHLASVLVRRLAKGLDSVRTVNALLSLRKVYRTDCEPFFEALCPNDALLASSAPEYRQYDTPTRNAYRALAVRYAKRQKMSEKDALRRAEARMQEKGCPLADVLRGRRMNVLYTVCATVLFVLLAIAGFAFLGWRFGFALLPVWEAVLVLCDIPAGRLLFSPPVYRVTLDEIPDTARTLVVTTLLLERGKGEAAVCKLEHFRLRNPGVNLAFGILGDLSDADAAQTDDDADTLSEYRNAVLAMNQKYGGGFCLFVRQRRQNSDGIWTGWERKRGAVVQLAECLAGGECFALAEGLEYARGSVYLLTLDADTDLPLGSVKSLLSAALHPYNRPIVTDGRLVRGYGILQPAIRSELASGHRTAFSLLYAGFGSAYECASFDREQSLHGQGVFCGKGLLHLPTFRALASQLPEGKILSHDLPEGCRAGCLLVNDVALTDGAPRTSISWFRRQHRWVRGDLQNAIFLLGNCLDTSGKRRVAANLRRAVLPVSAAAGLIAFGFFPSGAAWVGCIACLAHIVVVHSAALIRTVFSRFYTPRRFFSLALNAVAQNGFLVLYETAAIFETARTHADALLRAGWRMVRKKKLLEWVTFSATDAGSRRSLSACVLAFFPTTILGILMVLLSQSSLFRLLGLLWFSYPAVCALLSRPAPAERHHRLTAREDAEIRLYARKMFSFFRDRVDASTAFLPPDNVQLSPTDKTAARTSPTNIGLYLLSLLCARDFGFCDSVFLAERTEKAFLSLEKMERFRGHYYNWYDLGDLHPLTRYVSTVDSGNLVTMLITLANGLREYAPENERLAEIAAKAEKTAAETDFSFLYHSRRQLFVLGWNAEENMPSEICYDLMMSEVRTTCYYAVAANLVPEKLWQALARTAGRRNGYIGMLSWSGTAFEYFMPELFLKTPENSFLAESLRFALDAQKHSRRQGVFGVSESGHFAFDAEMNYQYRANGIPALALAFCPPEQFVVAPYASFLMLPLDLPGMLANLRRLRERGMYGEYGFFEALDFSHGNGEVVRSFMAHHLGMSLLACANTCMDGILQKRFFADARMAAASGLLGEGIPPAVSVYSGSVRPRLPISREDGGDRVPYGQGLPPACALISRNGLTAEASADGQIALRFGDYAINENEFAINHCQSTLSTAFFNGRQHFGVTVLDGENEGIFERSACSFSYLSNTHAAGITCAVDGATATLTVRLRGDNRRRLAAGICLVPLLAKTPETTHRAFSLLSLTADYNRENKILLFRRRGMRRDSRNPVLAVALSDPSMPFSFACEASGLPAHSVGKPSDRFDLPLLTGVESFSERVLTDPLCVLKTLPVRGIDVTFLLSVSFSAQEAIEAIQRCRKGIRFPPCQNKYGTLFYRLLPLFLYGTNIARRVDFGAECLWKAGVSGDFPLTVVFVYEENESLFAELSRACWQLSSVFLRNELLFVLFEREKYRAPLRAAVREAIRRSGNARAEGRRGGVFLCEASVFNREELDFLRSYAVYFTESDGEERKPSSLTRCNLPVIRQAEKEYPGESVGEFLADGFRVRNGGPLRPFSQVLAGYAFGTVVTHATLGFSFGRSARDDRATPFRADPSCEDYGKRVLLFLPEGVFDATQNCENCEYFPGIAVYRGVAAGHPYLLRVTVAPKVPVERIALCMEDGISVRAVLCVQLPCRETAVWRENETVLYRTMRSAGGSTFFLKAERGKALLSLPAVFGEEGDGNDIAAAEAFGKEAVFFLGVARNAEQAAVLCAPEYCAPEKSTDFAASFLPRIRLLSGEAGSRALFQVFVPYQTAFSRFLGKSGFFQTGGAWGFRDQLQDCLLLIYSSPRTVRTHLLRCAAQQYLEGDVMHWWNTTPAGPRGIRTTCSDDLLYLPFVVADYCKKTGDYQALDFKVSFVNSPPLQKNERFETPERTKERASLYEHCLRAFSAAYRIGEHGLLKMGICDWNDGMSAVGAQGKGESVFSTLLYALAVKAFLPIAERRNDETQIAGLRARASSLLAAVEEHCFFGDRYARAFDDRGNPLGVAESTEGKIDVLSQAFAVLALGRTNRTVLAMKTAFRELFDAEKKIFCLFSPPFEQYEAGYIRAYPPGIRENGGQYTHAALWAVWGMAEAGMKAEACTVMEALQPFRHCAKFYRGETYVMAADVASGERAGEAGWTWYTGSAAWYWKIMFEVIYGVTLSDGWQKITVKPLCEYTLTMELPESFLELHSQHGEGDAMLDGKKISFPAGIPAGKHTMTVFYS